MNKLVEEANAGSKVALEKVIDSVKDLVYNLSLRMLLFPEDAEDATQDILVKVVTHLSQFKGDSKLDTWVYRIAVNYLLNLKTKQKRKFASFKAYADQIDTGQSPYIKYTQNLGEQRLLEEEVKVSCTHGMLLCLNESNRMVYILGQILDFSSQEGAEILEMTPENFRKQLSRSKAKLRNFLQDKCGLANPKNPCRCAKKVDFLIQKQMINPQALRFGKGNERSLDLINTINVLERSAALYRMTPTYATPEGVVKKMKETINRL
ncbi:RNA polymerase sigma factor [Spongiimicrobium salis]|uniref:RNA polymerase sigma factor n=1 Tax=Spongiimicrobium salis TaxID=1667022 RepID=UPI00374C8C78